MVFGVLVFCIRQAKLCYILDGIQFSNDKNSRGTPGNLQIFYRWRLQRSDYQKKTLLCEYPLTKLLKKSLPKIPQTEDSTKVLLKSNLHIIFIQIFSNHVLKKGTDVQSVVELLQISWDKSFAK